MNKQFPIGKLSYSPDHSPEDREQWIDDIALLPGRIRDEIEGCSDDILLTPYRKDGWTVREVIEHLADSHMNTVIRLKSALAEDHPTIRPYDQSAWAVATGKIGLPLEFTLEFLEYIHEYMVRIFESLDEDQWQRTFYHPESEKSYTIDEVAALYAWHSNHHLAHIRLVTDGKSSSS
ncbi:YfiT family bacillithiol transferase [Gracilimonas mengyeensis]|uniref:DinB superfamily protein n=1 Tax=Gracilimonas mengyeensis TaxID=1302730 RepID=A0A521CR94_9BACT|nr:putative metal-dependent hydrolase [Gracilimonas mengyeensis]SMO61190.1 DinB superfamily protein [Gracilimonas mengyeensis]